MSTTHFYTAKQLAGLPGMPSTVAGVIYKSGKENWPNRQRIGRGGGREYSASALPKATQKALLAQRAVADLKAENMSLAEVERPTLPSSTVIVLKETQINDWQRHERDARDGVCQAVTALIMKGLSQEQAIHTILGIAVKEGPDSLEFRMLSQARDGRGIKRQNGEPNFPSVRSIQRWLAAGDLTPKKRQKDLLVPEWAADFLACYQQPQKPSVDAAYQEFCSHYRSERPSIHQVRRFLNKLPAIVLEKGRMGTRDIKNIKPFVRRTFEELWPNDVWSADGHTFDAEVQHPLHGQPFRPEITTIVDIGTRKAVGFSVSLAESSFTTVDALRHAITLHGVPAIFYVDNGSGYANEMLENAGTGLLSRFGISMKHSLPYNSQARGVIERFHRSVWVAAAKTLPSYIGADMDKQASDLNHKLTRRGDKNGVLHLPISWPNFIKMCEDAIEAYNQRSHSGLPKYVNADGKRQHYSPAEYWAYKAETLDGYHAVMVNPEDADMLFKPRIERMVRKGEINLFGNKYFCHDLALHHGDNVQVAYDIHDADFVWIYSGEGEFICKAEWGGNEQAYFAKPVIEMARDKRSDGREKRAEKTLAEIRAERDGRPALEVIATEELPGMRSVVRKLEEKQPVEVAATIPQEDRERYLFWRNLNEQALTGLAVPDSLLPFYNSFPNTAIWRSWHGFYSDSTGQERATL